MSKKNDFTELDATLREIALTDWKKFVQLIGPEAINKAKICLMRKQDRTLKYMAYRTNKPISTVADACKRCPDIENSGNP